ncbi:MAG: type II toxin-antitoxin system RelE/ParE family toxin [Acidobacteria bacterium]|nr:type II toxin-antitoxin system RelE/ParE family toxin [Acidobacteriota bacterium]
MSGYGFHPEAQFDLDEIWAYIGADNIEAAGRVVEDILAAVRALVLFPRQGQRHPELTSRPLRFIRVRNYLIAYAPEQTPLWVVAVIHGRQDPRVMAAILRGRE